MNLKALHTLSYGVYLCTSWDEGRPVGCVANCAVQITSDPATVAVSINKKNFTHACIFATGFFAIAVLAEDSDPKLIGKFGFTSGKDTDKFDGLPYTVRGKLPVPDCSASYVSCRVRDKWETETHTVFLGEITDADVLRGGKPMTYAYYHEVLKGKTAANAPTYRKEESAPEPVSEAPRAVYRCDVCGYEYDGEIPFEQLPDDWICPLCGMGKDHFEKIS